MDVVPVAIVPLPDPGTTGRQPAAPEGFPDLWAVLAERLSAEAGAEPLPPEAVPAPAEDVPAPEDASGDPAPQDPGSRAVQPDPGGLALVLAVPTPAPVPDQAGLPSGETAGAGAEPARPPLGSPRAVDLPTLTKPEPDAEPDGRVPAPADPRAERLWGFWLRRARGAPPAAREGGKGPGGAVPRGADGVLPKAAEAKAEGAGPAPGPGSASPATPEGGGPEGLVAGARPEAANRAEPSRERTPRVYDMIPGPGGPRTTLAPGVSPSTDRVNQGARAFVEDQPQQTARAHLKDFLPVRPESKGKTDAPSNAAAEFMAGRLREAWGGPSACVEDGVPPIEKGGAEAMRTAECRAASPPDVSGTGGEFAAVSREEPRPGSREQTAGGADPKSLHVVAEADAAAPMKPHTVQPTAPRPSQPPPAVDQVSRAVRVAIRTGSDRMTVQLEPAHLGRVHVEVAREAGGVAAHIRVETPQAHQLLLNELPALRAAAETRQVPLVHVAVEFDRGDGRPGDRPDPRPRGRRRATPDPLDDEVAVRSAWMPWGFETRI